MFIKFDNTYAKLPESFHKKAIPMPVASPNLICFNTELADSLGISYNKQNSKKIAEIFSGNTIPNGAEPIALAYAGHQFGYFVPQLGDGRAILLGEVIDKNNNRLDIQLKGSGITPYSRDGDGRAALGPMIREYIVSEAMHALGIKTTRSLALISTGEYVWRNGEMLPGAILTRVAESHIRIGTFEYFASGLDIGSIKTLADYAINRHYPQIRNYPKPYIALFECVKDAQINLTVEWMRVGFIHGVMNTDNMAISGETLDYGPCAFIDEYNPNKVFSSIDYHGRYSFSNQANICCWNLIQFAKIVALITDSDSEDTIELLHNSIRNFKSQYEKNYLAMMGRKIGIIKVNKEDDKHLINELLTIIYEEQADYTLTFRYLSCIICDNIDFNYNKLFTPSDRLKKWLLKWYDRLKKENISLEEISSMMLKTNPAIIPRNHKLEEIINYVIKGDNLSKIHAIMRALSDPYSIENEKHNIEYMIAPKPNERVYQTFCGT
jgi:uncharacterized protein YdiU (UPF0061 family)